jgi:hypothetical protein
VAQELQRTSCSDARGRTVEVTPEDEREVDRRLEDEHFDPGEDD